MSRSSPIKLTKLTELYRPGLPCFTNAVCNNRPVPGLITRQNVLIHANTNQRSKCNQATTARTDNKLLPERFLKQILINLKRERL